MEPPTGLTNVRAEGLSAQTAQTTGMVREQAISHVTAGSTAIWMGRTIVPPHTDSGPHHHGVSETCISVVSGRPNFRFVSAGEEHLVETAPGDYVFVPPHVHHIEENPHDEPAVVVIARSTQEAIVHNLESL